MKSRYFPFMLGSLFALTATAPLVVPMTAHAQDEPQDAQANEDAEVLTRGPVHEAFAEAVSYEAEPGLIVKSAPPAAIEELPPDQKPTGDNVTWIPGYWGWDDDQSDFLWISGVWRNVPPERQWVPGYWNDLGDESFQWISGYWSDNETEEVEYVQAAPPKSIDSGPNIAAPSEDHTWVPGNWLWNDSRYVWRPGYWLELRQNWTWVPARYNYTPRGYAYVDGYWDYAVADRGVLFAPVHFRRNVWASPGYYYTPSIVVSLNLFTDHLWVRPRCNHYYFGDYYAPRYADLGFYAGYSWHRHRRGYDPIWAYDRWEHRRDRDWERRYEDNFNFFRNNDRFRPPHTWAAMRGLGNERLEGGRNRLFASSFNNLVNNPDRRQQFRQLDREGRDRFVAQGKEVRNFGRQRRDLETVKIAAADRGQNAEDRNKGVFRDKLRRSPVAGREAAQFAKNEGPPKRPEGRGRTALKEAAAAAAANPERGKGRDLAQRQGGDAVAPGRGGLAGKGQGQGREGRAQDPSIAQQERGKAQREKSAQDGQAQLKQQQRDKATPERQVQPKPQREKATPERQVQPKPQREKATPERQVQPKQQQREKVAPERQVQPKQQQREKAAPQQREAQPKRQVVPERKAQPQQPQRQAQPRQPQVKPQQNRQAKEKDKAQASVAPQQRRQQANVQRASAQPKPQVQRQAQPQQQKAQPKPQQRQVQPRQQHAQPKPQQRPQVQQRQAQQPRQQQQARPQQRQAQPRQQQQSRPQQQQRQNKKDRDKKDSA